MPRDPESALRRLASELTRAEAEDVDAILSRLSEDRRARVRALMRGEGASAARTAPAPPAAAPFGGAVRLEGVSPWLEARLRARSLGPQGDASAVAPYAMTPDAFEALQACARRLGGVEAPDRERTSPPWLQLRGLLHRFVRSRT